MKNDSNSYYAVDGFHCSTAIIPALTIFLFLFASIANAANPPVPPSNPVGFTTVTTPYSSSTSPRQISHIPPNGMPNVGGGSSYPVPPTRPITPIVSGGGFITPTKGGITITGVKTPPIPITGKAHYPPAVVKNGAKTLLRGNLAGLVLGAGLQQLLNGLGWVMGPGGQIQQTTTVTEGGMWWAASRAYSAGSPEGVIDVLNASCPNCYTYTGQINNTTATGLFRGSYPVEILRDVNVACPPPYEFNSEYHCVIQTTTPLSNDDLDDGVDNSYNPTPSDFDNLSPHMFPNSYTQDSIPTFQLPTVTTTTTNASGDTITTNTTTSINFKVDNSKPNPDVETTVTDNTESFTNGQPSGSSSTSTTTKPNTNPQAPPDPAGGGTTAQFPEIPTDCEFMPTVCAFIDWFKQEPEEPDDDLSELFQEVPIVSETFTITGGAAACPAPIVLNLSQFGSREVSYQPLCDLASTMKFLYLALMSFAAAVLLNRSINRV